MAKTVLNPSSARKNFYKLLKDVNENHTEIEIISERSENNAVLIGLDDWKAIKETLLLEQIGTLGVHLHLPYKQPGVVYSIF
ncbi:prevent-host-death protein [Enterococcus faecium]|uniref:type II toxin-antitoxin system Phd/YefM family antitoxin n=1 Tax=Enterococcus faecium TaxID=1352 RepID=UPI000763C88D|nr:type II toxin-antitoxin system Phd/YefM family antitoxin [Enterococcus faecium]KWY47040.1 prevent-host-death protein [Enterococcus faecium]